MAYLGNVSRTPSHARHFSDMSLENPGTLLWFIDIKNIAVVIPRPTEKKSAKQTQSCSSTIPKSAKKGKQLYKNDLKSVLQYSPTNLVILISEIQPYYSGKKTQSWLLKSSVMLYLQPYF